ncbi:MAG: hypothetical protein HY675_05920 [Chloroflexi bacterium]|nr:hypothetical protein [Chloroflexota bacterium]
MIIDAHNHVYPEKIARLFKEKASGSASALVGLQPRTIPDLLSAMDQSGIEGAVFFCVARKEDAVINKEQRFHNTGL